MNALFWPPRFKHVVQTVDLSAPSLDPVMTALIRKILVRTEALRSIQACSEPDPQVVDELRKSIANCLLGISERLNDADSRQAIDFISAGLVNSVRIIDTAQAQAGLDEQELVCHVGNLSAWLGKSRENFFSAFFGIPNLDFKKYQIA